MAENKVPVKTASDIKKEFEKDTLIVADQTSAFVQTMQPAYMVSQSNLGNLMYDNSAELLDAVTFFKIKSCSSEH